MIDSTGHAEIVSRFPRLFHLLYKPNDLVSASVLENGLVSGYPRHEWHPLWEPRPDHVYLATPAYVKKSKWLTNDTVCDVFAVDTSQLDRRRINPDEDHFRTDDEADGVDGNMLGDRAACQAFRLPLPPTPWQYDWVTYLKLAPLPSYGDWAEAVGLGGNPTETRYSVHRGSIAYKGTIPPLAISLVKVERDTELLVESL